MRAKVQFRGEEGMIFSTNYDNDLSYNLIYKIKSLFKDSSFEDFDYFTFSAFSVVNSDRVGDSLVSIDGTVEIVLSSCDEDFLRQLLTFFVLGEPLVYDGNELFFLSCDFLDDPDFSKELSFTTISPIFLGDFDENQDLSEFLSSVLVEKYESFYGLDDCGLSLSFSYNPDMFKSNDIDIFHGYWCSVDFNLRGDLELVKFAWDVGLGYRNCQGFGMLEVI